MRFSVKLTDRGDDRRSRVSDYRADEDVSVRVAPRSIGVNVDSGGPVRTLRPRERLVDTTTFSTSHAGAGRVGFSPARSRLGGDN
jgi:hypothetical protein